MKTERAVQSLLLARWEERGDIGFDEFLQLVLHHPEVGYYHSGHGAVGWKGDFFTSVSVGAIFGEILCQHFQKIWVSLDRPPVFHLIEQGANDGALMADVLSAAASEPRFAKSLQPVVIEPSPSSQKRQKERLSLFSGKISWVESPDALEPFCGVHFSNELVDALPFVLLRFSGGRWQERAVCWNAEKGWEFRLRPLSPELEKEASVLPVPTREPYDTEIRPAAKHWLREVASRMKKGVLIACDYGFLREEYYSPERHTGTLLCYQKHRRDENPLENIGEKDISAHVDFSALKEGAESAGFAWTQLVDQHHFLVKAGSGWLRSLDGKKLSPTEQKKLRAFQMLVHPESMGRKFRFFSAGKGVEA